MAADIDVIEIESVRSSPSHKQRYQIVVISFAILIFFICITSPPSLMDDMDSVQAQIARNMLKSGDWVTARLDGVPYLEKPPLKYWMIAVTYLVFGVHDWAARIPVALSAVLLCWIVYRFGVWAFGEPAGFYAAMCQATCIGLFLFTRVLLVDVILTVAIASAMWALIRLLEERRSYRWPLLFWSSMGAGLLLKGLVGVLFPAAITLIYLCLTRRIFVYDILRRFRITVGLPLFLVLTVPWHVLAIAHNPPAFDFTLHSEAGSYRGFFWFYFINEQVLRFLNRRYPRDYNTVPHVWFWLYHLLWLFPWSMFLPAIARLDYRSADRASRVRLLALCWISFVLLFFSLSTTQEYYTMPCYPAFALLIGSALASKAKWIRIGGRLLGLISAVALLAVLSVLYLVRNTPAVGDISGALGSHPEAYTLSLGHLKDLTVPAFAYLKLPLAAAGVALTVGALGSWRGSRTRLVMSVSVMMLLFFHAARLALVVFDPYLSSRPLAEALKTQPAGVLIVGGDNPYYEFSSVFFYADTTGLLLNGRRSNLEYGSYAPGAPNVFIDDVELKRLWGSADRYYLVTEGPKVPHLESVIGTPALHQVLESGGKFLFSNQ